MKLAFCFGPISVGNRPFDFSRIEEDPRGLTGTDGSFLSYAKFMAQRGHDVTLFVDKQSSDARWGKLAVRPYEARRTVDDSWDACLAWNDVAALGAVSPKVARIVDMQLNNFEYVRDAREYDAVDAFVSASRSLGDRLRHMGPPSRIPWFTVYNGCDRGAYDLVPKVPGRCIYASSPDRGLHIALAEWPRVRAAAPHAELRIFYHSMTHWFEMIDWMLGSGSAVDEERGRRAVFVRDHLEQPGVVHIGSSSRAQMAREYSEAQVLAYPCDPVAYTEGYAVAIIEGCASGAVPVISRADALPEIYEGACPMVDAPCGAHAREWGDLVIKMLTDEGERLRWEALGRERARKFDYRVLAGVLEGIVTQVKARKVR